MAKTKPTTSGATRLSELSSGRQDVLNIDPAIIVTEDGFNYRDFTLPENKEHVQDLKKKIAAAGGVLQPLLVRFDPETKLPILIDGECRLRAVKELLEEGGTEIKTVPVIQKKNTTEAERVVMSLTANGQKPPSICEAGEAYKRLQTGGWTVEEIAQKTGNTVQHVNAAIELTVVDKPTRRLISMGAVSVAHARSEVKRHGEKASLVIQMAVKKAKEQQEAKKAAKAGKGDGGKKKPGRKPKEDKPVVVKRAKAKGGRFIKDDVLALITKALEAAKESDDVGIQLSAESALEALNDKE